jgi:hypothetical protein
LVTSPRLERQRHQMAGKYYRSRNDQEQLVANILILKPDSHSRRFEIGPAC